MSDFLTKDAVFALSDIDIKEVTIPDDFMSTAWRGKKFFIRQLTRGQQDQYLKRQFGDTKMRQDAKAKNQEISAVNIYGHDAWLCVQGMCDEKGSPLFTIADIEKLNTKSGAPIGWIASEIIKFSDMAKDEQVARGELSPEKALEDDVKNS